MWQIFRECPIPGENTDNRIRTTVDSTPHSLLRISASRTICHAHDALHRRHRPDADIAARQSAALRADDPQARGVGVDPLGEIVFPQLGRREARVFRQPAEVPRGQRVLPHERIHGRGEDRRSSRVPGAPDARQAVVGEAVGDILTHGRTLPDKAPAYRVRGPGQTVHIRRDSRWSVPEPELVLVISPALKLVGFTAGNDMSSRDIEGENPLYLPQAKFYDHSCALGPVITLADAMPAHEQTHIHLIIERAGQPVFEGATTLAAMARPFEELIAWLGKETSFPHGVMLLTGTGIIPPDDFTLAAGDLVHIDITGIGRLSNPVAMRAE